MIKLGLFAAGLFAALQSTAAFALPYGFYDARSVAMGNASVATGGITTAALSNPGMLRVNETDDKVALLLPALGVQLIDDGNIVDLIDEFQSIEQNASDPLSIADLARLQGVLIKLDGASLIGAVVPNAAFVYSGDEYTWGISVRANAVVSAGIENITTDLFTLATNPDATIKGLGVLISEVGIPLGTDVEISGMKLSVGITPRFVQVQSIEYSENISTADLQTIQDMNTEDLGNFTTMDAGVTLNLLDSFRVGLVAKNLISNTKVTSLGRKINFDTQLRIGAAYELGFMTLAADMDLTERAPIAYENPYQSFSVGAEFNIYSVLQLRAGYQKNMASGATDPDLLSLGVGLSLGFHMDIAAVIGEDSSLGVFAQTGFRF